MRTTHLVMQTKELILKNCDIPTVPLVAVKILNLVKDYNSDVNDIQNAILADQALSARVLQIANSAYYGMRRKIDTISEAIVFMGLETIRNLVLAMSTREAFKRFGLLEQKLWEHSIGVSVAAGLIARQIYFDNPEEAMVAGLLHDIGKVVMSNSQQESFLVLAERVYNEQVTYFSIEKEIFGFGHAEVGGLFAQKWGFPDMLCDVITRHHSHDPTSGEFAVDPYLNTLCCIVALADALCLRLGVGYRGPMADLDLMDVKWREILKISNTQFSQLMELFKQTYIEKKLLYQE